MADLPEYRRRTLVEQIGVVRAGDTGEGLFRVSAAAAQAAREFGAEAHREGSAQRVADAQDAADNMVTLDDQGRVLVEPRPNDSTENRAFNARLEVGTRSRFLNHWTAQATEFAAKAKNDPELFRSSWTGAAEGATLHVPSAWRSRFEADLTAIGNQHYARLAAAQVARETDLAQQAWSVREKALGDRLRALADQGAMGTPAYMQAAADHSSHIIDGVNAQFINQDLGTQYSIAVADEAEGRAIANQALRIADREGKAAAFAFLEREVRNPDLQMPEARRELVINRFQERIREHDAARTADLGEVRGLAARLQERMRLGGEIAPDLFPGLARRARNLGDAELAEDLDATGRMQLELSSMAKLPLGDLQAKLAGIEDRVRDQGTAASLELLRKRQAVAALLDTKSKFLQRDAWSYGLQAHADIVGRVEPIDWAAPDKAVAQLAGREGIAQRLAVLTGVPTLPVSAGEAAGLNAAYEASDSAGRVRLLRTLTQGAPRYVPAIAARMFEKPEERAFATAAGLAIDAPDVAEAVVRGHAAVKADKKLLPSDDQTFRVQLQDRLRGAFRGTDPATFGAVRDAIMAHYANDALRENDLSGRPDWDRLQKAIDAVTGGVLRWNGATIVAPNRAVRDADSFAQVMDALTDADLAGAVATGNNRAITADQLRRHGALTSIGAGLYAIEIYGHGVMSAEGRPFVLNLRDKRPVLRSGFTGSAGEIDFVPQEMPAR